MLRSPVLEWSIYQSVVDGQRKSVPSNVFRATAATSTVGLVNCGGGDEGRVRTPGACVRDGAWWWHRTAGLLLKQGVSSVAPPLPSCGEGGGRPGGVGIPGLPEDVAAVRQVLLDGAEPTVVLPTAMAGSSPQRRRTFPTLEDGVQYAEEIGFEVVIERGVRAVEQLPTNVVYGGFSLGVLPALRIAQTHPGTLGALLYYSCVPVSVFGVWPEGVPVQVHGMDADPIFAGEGDIEAARELVASTAHGEL